MPISLFFRVLLVSSVFVLFCSSAHALRVKNRSPESQQLSIATTQGDERVIELAPGEVFFSYSPYMRLRLLTGQKGGEHTVRFLDEYTIWPDGTLAIQKRRWPRHKAF